MPPIPTRHTLKVDEAEPLLRQLIAPTRLRARLYSRTAIWPSTPATCWRAMWCRRQELPPLDAWSQIKEWLQPPL